jgi:Histidine kinase sensor domain
LNKEGDLFGKPASLFVRRPVQRKGSNLRQWLCASLQTSTFLGLAMIGLLWTGLTLHLSEERESALRGAKQNAGNLARVFEEHVVRVVEEADKALLSLRAQYAKNPEQFNIGNARVYLDDLILQIGVIGPDGILKATTLPLAPYVRMDLSHQKHYRIHLNTDKDDLYISKPVIGRTTGKTNIQLSRRLSSPDGSFSGVIVASIDQSSLSRFYNSIDIGNDGSIVVMGVDHIVRVSRGFKNIKPESSFPAHFLFTKLKESPTGFFVSQGLVDSITRLVSYRKLKKLPLIVTVGLAQHEVFAGYWEGRRQYYTASTILTAGILIAILFGTWHKRRLLAAKDDIQWTQQALAQSQERHQLVETAVNDGIFDRNI